VHFRQKNARIKNKNLTQRRREAEAQREEREKRSERKDMLKILDSKNFIASSLKILSLRSLRLCAFALKKEFGGPNPYRWCINVLTCSSIC
jgi:hypothetical protein